MKVIGWLVVGLSVMGCGVAAAQTGTPRERLEKASAGMALADITAKPWHATLAVTLFDEHGQNPVEGTIEYWQAGNESRRVMKFGDSVNTHLKHEAALYYGTSGKRSPDLAIAVFEEFMNPGPTARDLADTEPEARKQSFGKVSLSCIMATRPIKRVVMIPLGLFPTYCLDASDEKIVASFSFGSWFVNVTQAGRFMEHNVATEFSFREKEVTVATAKVTAMGTFEPTPETFVPEEELQKAGGGGVARIGSAVIAGQRLTWVPPVYPDSAKAARLSGTVTLRALIGTDGRVHQLHVMSTPDPDLAIASIASVMKWTYRPYLLNGEPTDVDTTIIVNFNLN